VNLHIRDTAEWLANPYELIRWILYVFIGGAISIVPFATLSDYYIRLSIGEILNHPPPLVSGNTIVSGQSFYYTPIEYASLFLAFTLVYSLMLITSLALTRVFPDRKVVPPFFMQMIVLVWFLSSIFSIGQYYQLIPQSDYAGNYTLSVNQSILTWYLLGGVFLFVSGFTQDRVVTGVVGRTARYGNILRYSMKVMMEPKALRDLLLIEKFRRGLSVSRKTETDASGSIYLWRRFGFTNVLQIELRPNKETRDGKEMTDTVMNVIGYERRAYYVQTSDSQIEGFNGDLYYIKSILDRHDPPISYSKEPDTNADKLVYQAIDELQGLSPHIERVSKLGWLKLGGFIAALFISGFFFLSHDPTNGFILIGSAFLLLAFELPSRIRARGE